MRTNQIQTELLETETLLILPYLRPSVKNRRFVFEILICQDPYIFRRYRICSQLANFDAKSPMFSKSHICNRHIQSFSLTKQCPTNQRQSEFES